MDAPSPPTRAPGELLDLALTAIAAAQSEGAVTRLVGGLAVYALAEAVRREPLARTYKDFDLVAPAKTSAQMSRALMGLGFTPNRHFNALHGARRLIFESPDGFPVDVLLGEFEMCHRIDVASGLSEHPVTIAPADLLLTKLQIVQIEGKDLGDAIALLLDLEPGSGFPLERFLAPLADDWGFHRTVTINLEKTREHARTNLGVDAARRVEDRVDVLLEAMDRVAKSMRWKMRARIGERVQWYELPEEV